VSGTDLLRALVKTWRADAEFFARSTHDDGFAAKAHILRVCADELELTIKEIRCE
jgi:hypothetical protein